MRVVVLIIDLVVVFQVVIIFDPVGLVVTAALSSGAVLDQRITAGVMLAVAVIVGLGECIWIVKNAKISTPFEGIATACTERHLDVARRYG